ncbi:MAG: hypothetical protein AB7O88_01695 [Reyranellaceae bacterium]
MILPVRVAPAILLGDAMFGRMIAAAMAAMVCGLLSVSAWSQAAKPADSPIVAWKARAATYAAALPEPLPGWTATKPGIEASNSPMNKVVGAYRHYRLGQHTANLDSVMIAIHNNPDGSARYPIALWKDEAKRKAKGWTMTKAAGRDALEGKNSKSTELYFLMSNNLFVKLSWQEGNLPRAKVDEYLKVIDFAKIEKLAPK